MSKPIKIKTDKKSKAAALAKQMADDVQKVLLTKEGLKKVYEELEYLSTKKRDEIASRLQEAVAHGDLSENSEYDEAKNEQAFVEARIRELQEIIEKAEIISSGHAGSTVELGCKVQVHNITLNQNEVYKIVGSTEADPSKTLISNESPVGKAFLGREVGEKVVVDVPKGKVEYEIMKIE